MTRTTATDSRENEGKCGGWRILCDLLRLCFRFLFCFILAPTFSGHRFCYSTFSVVFPPEKKCGKVCQWNCCCTAAVSVLSTLFFKVPQANHNLWHSKWAKEKHFDPKSKWTPVETDISDICVLYIIEHPDQAYAGFVLATIFGQFLELIALICHLPRCVYATSHKGAHYVCGTHTYANIMAHRTGQ